MTALSPMFNMVFEHLERVIDERVGLIRSLQEIPREAGAPHFFHYYAEACNTGAFTGCNFSPISGGAASNRAGAAAKAIGEVIERYCSSLYSLQDLPLTSYDSASFPCVHPKEFALFSQGQHAQDNFPYVAFTSSTPIHWCPLTDWYSQKSVFAPAAMVFVPYIFDKPNGEQPFCQPISTGLACHIDPDQARLSAICEVIERDAFTITWQAQLKMPRIVPKTLSEENQDLVRRFEHTGAHVSLFHLKMDHGVPVIFSALQHASPDMPALVFAAAASLDPEQAVKKSLEELAHTRRLAHILKSHYPPKTLVSDYRNVRTQNDHVHFYCDPRNAFLAKTLFQSSTWTDFDDIPNLATGIPKRDVAILVQDLHRLNYSVLLRDLTTPDVKDLGFFVMRAVIPGFHPLIIGHAHRPLGGKRLWTLPQRLGHRGIRRERGDNPAPHPFP